MNILLISYHFPPISTGGVERAVSMKKYLPRYGHRVTVITHSYRRTDLTSNPEVLRFLDVNRLNRLPIQWVIARLQERIGLKIRKYVAPHRRWRAEILRHAQFLESVTTPDVILATYPPMEALEVGLDLSSCFRKPLVSDFRDGFLFEPIDRAVYPGSPAIDYFSQIERLVVKRSSAIITVSEPISEDLRRRFGYANVVTIPNGFDPDELQPKPQIPLLLDHSFINIVHTGRLSFSDPTCEPFPFFAALADCLGAEPKVRKQIRVTMVGQLSREERKAAEPLVRAGICNVVGPVNRDLSFQYQAEASLLLLITSTKRTSVATGKLFEYLGSGNPILALTRKTFAEQIIRDTGAGWLVDPGDRRAIAAFIGGLASNPSMLCELRRNEAAILNYSRPQQLKLLSDVLGRVHSPVR